MGLIRDFLGELIDRHLSPLFVGFYKILELLRASFIPVLARAQLWALVGARNTPVAAIQKYSRVIVNYSREDDYFTERKPTHKIVR